jgi:hypothetical protein
MVMLVLTLALLAVYVVSPTPPTPAEAHPQLHRGCTNTLLGHY